MSNLAQDDGTIYSLIKERTITMKKTLSRIISLFLAFITLFGIMTVPASAASTSAANSVCTVNVDTSGGKFYVVKTDNAKLKTKANASSPTYATITKGSLILTSGTSGKYYEVKFGSSTYYIHKNDIKKASSTYAASIDYVTQNNAPFRKGPAQGFATSYKQNKGTTFYLVGGLTNSAGNYWEIAYKDGKLYYVYSGNCARVCAVAALKVSGNDTIDIRTSTQLTASYSPAAIKNGVTWYSSNPAVATVDANGVVTGNSAGTAVITAIDNAISGLSTSVTITVTPCVQLNVPLLKQTDPRWKNQYYGGSSADIGTYGCTLTSLTMIYNYYNEPDTTPNVLDDSLVFDAGGNIYWYSVENLMGYSRHSYNGLADVYAMLKLGRPVLIGGKNSSGTPHWVVITGYNGDGYSFDAKYFTINDSGANRTTLDQYIAAYPTVKTLVY